MQIVTRLADEACRSPAKTTINRVKYVNATTDKIRIGLFPIFPRAGRHLSIGRPNYSPPPARFPPACCVFPAVLPVSVISS